MSTKLIIFGSFFLSSSLSLSQKLSLPSTIIDTHVHLSNLSFSYPWANSSCGFACPAAPPCLCEWDFTAYKEATVSLPTTKFVFVEVDVIPSLWLTEAQWVQSLAESGVPVAAIIAQPPPGFGVPGTNTTSLQIAAAQLAALPLARGVRIANVNFSDDSIMVTVISHTMILFNAGLKSFDIIAGGFPLALGQGNIIKLARALPSCNFILDHIGNPPYLLDKSHADEWAQAMSALGAEPNIFCKVGGLLQGFKSTKKVPSVDDLRPWIVHSINSFGFARSLYEGNWFFANWLIPAELQIYEIYARYILEILLEIGATTADVNNYFAAAASAAYHL